MTSEASEHLLNLDLCQNRECRRGYLAVLLAAERAGFQVSAGAKGAVREMQIRDGAPQPFSLIVNANSLLFYIRRPALDENPGLAGQARAKFGDRVLSGENSLNEVRIRLNTESDAEDLTDWLFPNPGYAARRSA